MADTKSAVGRLYLREEELRQVIELLFFAYRDFTSDLDAILRSCRFGRAHHRVIHFVGRHPGISVADLLGILRITKQSLSRVLNQLIAGGYISQRPDANDRRRRMLALTEKGRELERRLSAPQQARVARAFREAGAEAVEGYRRVLTGLIDDENRAAILRLIGRP
ncbi:MAG: MarR family transcriptional regulator [Alphaproteobacteria bacterium]|nr:MarR family transcriptional regulator [Alphaproteobacteria bacterium]